MPYQTPKTNWTPADGVADVDLNRIEGNIADTKAIADAALPKSGGKMTGPLITPTLKIGSDDTYQTVEKKLSVTFAEGVSNQKAEVVFDTVPGHNSFFVLDVSIQANWAGSNATGIVTKRFYIGCNDQGTFFHKSSRYIETGGLTPAHFAIGDFFWAPGSGKYGVLIVSRLSYSNIAHVTIKAMTATAHTNFISSAYMGPVYTADGTVYPVPVVDLPQDITVNGRGVVTHSGNASTSNANTLAVDGYYNVSSIWTGSPYAGEAGQNQGYLEHRNWNGSTSYCTQTFIEVNGEKRRWFRIKDNNVWGGWNRFWGTDYLRDNNGTIELFTSGAWKVVGGGVKSIQRGVFSSGASGTFNIPINPVDINKSVIILSNLDTAASGTTHHEFYLSSSTQITVDNAGSNYWPKIRWQVIEYS